MSNPHLPELSAPFANRLRAREEVLNGMKPSYTALVAKAWKSGPTSSR